MCKTNTARTKITLYSDHDHIFPVLSCTKTVHQTSKLVEMCFADYSSRWYISIRGKYFLLDYTFKLNSI